MNDTLNGSFHVTYRMLSISVASIGVMLTCSGYVHSEIVTPGIASAVEEKIEPKIDKKVEGLRREVKDNMDAHERDYTRQLKRIDSRLESIDKKLNDNK